MLRVFRLTNWRVISWVYNGSGLSFLILNLNDPSAKQWSSYGFTMVNPCTTRAFRKSRARSSTQKINMFLHPFMILPPSCCRKLVFVYKVCWDPKHKITKHTIAEEKKMKKNKKCG